jgi:aldehyde dehydrogenase (NAD+)
MQHQSRAGAKPHPFLDGSGKKLFIDGAWVDALAGRTFPSISPVDGSTIVELADGDAADIDVAVAAARRAFEGPWARMKPYERQAILLRFADLLDRDFDDIATLDTIDIGAPISFTASRRERCVGLLRYYASAVMMLHGETVQSSIPGDFFTFTVKEPMGVVGAIIPSNSPLSSALLKVGPALATGCTVVLKPSPEGSLTPLRLAELSAEAGLPPGVLNVVTSRGAEAGAALVRHEGVDKIAFTGSHLTGQKIVQASAGNLKRLTLELGGKSPNIVFADADLDAAAPAAAMAVFINTGQVCVAGSRLFVERKIYDQFVERLAVFAKGLRVGEPLDPQTHIGPLVSSAQLDRVTGYFVSGKAEGARAVTGGERLTEGALAKGYFVAPTLFADVTDDMGIAREEIFGPVISAIPFDDPEDLVRRANSTIFGLGCGIWTRDVSRAHKMARAVRAGNVWVNNYAALDVQMPFGGYKMSGYGRETGRESLDAYLETKSVFMKLD